MPRPLKVFIAVTFLFIVVSWGLLFSGHPDAAIRVALLAQAWTMGFFFWTVLVHSRRRWPTAGIGERAYNMITFRR